MMRTTRQKQREMKSFTLQISILCTGIPSAITRMFCYVVFDQAINQLAWVCSAVCLGDIRGTAVPLISY
jgi:hypothetical protein